MSGTPHQQLRTHLKNAHALEQQSLGTLEAGIHVADDPDFEQTIRGHITETREHEKLIAERLEAHGESPSKLRDAAGRAGAGIVGGAAVAAPDTPAKLAAAAYAFEHFEIAAYELLKRVAAAARDEETVAVCDRILSQERSAAEKVSWHFDAVVEKSLEREEVTS